ncbi:bile acid:sodium symporter family protein [Henriciella sp. AS95]|uniref:bile acid:sodium symporter family protein n=1 Tax=Henriciella sp. AS95 TaxID=3135782 RepID=UPI00316E8B6F
MKFIPDRFVLLMIGAVILALIFPQLGTSDGPLRLGTVTEWGIALVFFLHGANLDRQKLVTGLKNWRVHLLIQTTTFVVFPILGLILYFSLRQTLPEFLLLGFFFVAALPSTVSSSVAMTALARGNVPVAVFNATLSGLLGMIITPALMSIVTATGETNFSVLDAMVDIAITLLLPFILGQLARPLIKTLLVKYKSITSKIDRGVILLIVFSSFAESTAGGVWSQFSLVEFVVTIALVLVFLGLAFSYTIFASKRLSLPLDDESATVFCGSTKSLANGAPIAQILFAGNPSLGLIMLPLMLYHQLQLMACAVMAQRYARKTEEMLEAAAADAPAS